MDSARHVDRSVEVSAADAKVLTRLSGVHAPAETLALLLRETRSGVSGELRSRLRALLDLPPLDTAPAPAAPTPPDDPVADPPVELEGPSPITAAATMAGTPVFIHDRIPTRLLRIDRRGDLERPAGVHGMRCVEATLDGELFEGADTNAVLERVLSRGADRLGSVDRLIRVCGLRAGEGRDGRLIGSQIRHFEPFMACRAVYALARHLGVPASLAWRPKRAGDAGALLLTYEPGPSENLDNPRRIA